MNSRKTTFISISIILIFIISFFANLFVPVSSLFVTPDFGQSDIWQLNLPLKFFLSSSLKNNTLPLWSQNLATGFPVIAEGQIGAFNIFNILLFKFLPFVWAYNLTYIIIFITTAIGTYLYLRMIKIGSLIALFSSLTFTFSGFFITHVPHLNLIQTASFLPWLFLLGELIINTRKKLYFVLFSLILSQQIFSGFPQITFITLFTLYTYFLIKIVLAPKNNRACLISIFIKVICFTVLGFGLSAIQILPQSEFLSLSTREKGFDQTMATFFSFPIKHLLTFINPYAIGTPQNGTYPNFIDFNGSMFWENNGFMGFLPFLMGLVGIFLFKKTKYLLIYTILLLVSFLLMLGKFSPLYLIYSMPPFSYFRVPSRFIFPFIWSLCILSSFSLDYILRKIKNQSIKKRYFSYLVILLFVTGSLLHLFSFSYTYNRIEDTNKVLSPPETALYLNNKSDGRIFLMNDSKSWNNIFETSGWKDFSPFLYFRNDLKADFNLVYQIPSFNVYPILLSKRYDLLTKLIQTGFNSKNGKFSLNPSTIKLLSLYNTKYIITTYPLEFDPNLEMIYETKNNYKTLPSYKIYLIKTSLPKVYFVNKITKVDTVANILELVNKDEFNINKEVFSEKSIPLKNNDSLVEYHTGITQDTDGEMSLNLSTNNSGALVFSDSYYPGWKAYINGQPTEIFPVNLNSKAILIREPGRYKVMFKFESESLKKGILISTVTASILIFLMGLTFLSSFFHKSPGRT